MNASTNDLIALERAYGARNYDPLPVVLSRGEGVWLWDAQGAQYLDMLSAYSAVSFGYGHPRLVAALTQQAQRLAVTSRAFFSDRLPPFLKKLCEVTGMERALPMSTGAGPTCFRRSIGAWRPIRAGPPRLTPCGRLGSTTKSSPTGAGRHRSGP